ncbi:MAG: Crp/Fnr family transcriptional regulator [Hyphomicrobium sp.]
MVESKQTLAGIEIFRDVSADDLDALANRCQWRRYAADQQILGHMNEMTDVFFIVDGTVRAVSYSLSGKEVMYRDIGGGEMFGEYAAIDGQPRSANVVAVTDTLIASMSAGALWEVLAAHPVVAAMILRRLTKQIRNLTERIFEFSTLAVRNRIHAELLRLARDHVGDGDSAVFSPAPTHAEIASRVSTHREAVTRELNNLAHAGLIEQHGRVLTIRSISKLARMVEEVLGT